MWEGWGPEHPIYLPQLLVTHHLDSAVAPWGSAPPGSLV